MYVAMYIRIYWPVYMYVTVKNTFCDFQKVSLILLLHVSGSQPYQWSSIIRMYVYTSLNYFCGHCSYTMLYIRIYVRTSCAGESGL